MRFWGAAAGEQVLSIEGNRQLVTASAITTGEAGVSADSRSNVAAASVWSELVDDAARVEREDRAVAMHCKIAQDRATTAGEISRAEERNGGGLAE